MKLLRGIVQFGELENSIFLEVLDYNHSGFKIKKRVYLGHAKRAPLIVFGGTDFRNLLAEGVSPLLKGEAEFWGDELG